MGSCTKVMEIISKSVKSSLSCTRAGCLNESATIVTSNANPMIVQTTMIVVTMVLSFLGSGGGVVVTGGGGVVVTDVFVVLCCTDAVAERITMGSPEALATLAKFMDCTRSGVRVVRMRKSTVRRLDSSRRCGRTPRIRTDVLGRLSSSASASPSDVSMADVRTAVSLVRVRVRMVPCVEKGGVVVVGPHTASCVKVHGSMARSHLVQFWHTLSTSESGPHALRAKLTPGVQTLQDAQTVSRFSSHSLASNWSSAHTVQLPHRASWVPLHGRR
jgi:hypothetical protein